MSGGIISFVLSVFVVSIIISIRMQVLRIKPTDSDDIRFQKERFNSNLTKSSWLFGFISGVMFTILSLFACAKLWDCAIAMVIVISVVIVIVAGIIVTRRLSVDYTNHLHSQLASEIKREFETVHKDGRCAR